VAGVRADYAGFEIEDEFVVGYGLDYKGFYRNLRCIGTLSDNSLFHGEG
jgi:hypoxanthine phosphoribosyltransferase